MHAVVLLLAGGGCFFAGLVLFPRQHFPLGSTGRRLRCSRADQAAAWLALLAVLALAAFGTPGERR